MWSYRFADLVSDVDIDVFDLTDPTFEALIITAGTFRATLPVPNPDVARSVRRIVPLVDVDPQTGQSVTVPQSICHVYDGRDLWSSYVIWTADLTVDEHGATSVALQGAELRSWLDHRLVDVDVTFTNTDQIEIARQLILNAQIGWGTWAAAADLGITVEPGSSGITRDRTYRLSEATSTAQRIEELANVEQGFEWRLHTYANADGGRVREWRWGYPMLGGQLGRQVYTLPGNITSLKLTTDITGAGTAFWARGDTAQDDLTDDSQPLITPAPWVRADLLARGWPWLDSVSDHQGVTDPGTLDAYARAYAGANGGVIRTLTVKVRVPPSGAARFMPARLGDRVRLAAITDYWPPDEDGRPTFAATPRVVGLKMTPAGRGQGVDLAELVLADDGAGALIVDPPKAGA